jgi:hypothetical protein
VFRYLHVVAAVLFSSLLIAAEPPPHASPPALPPPPPSPPATSTIYSIQDPNALTLLEENPAVTRRMVDRVMRAATGQSDTASAWRTLVTPEDRVGIKVSTIGGHYLGSHRGIVEAILAGLESAGIPRS